MFFLPLLAAAVCLLSLLTLQRAAERLGLLDLPGVRKVHAVPIPRVGGLGILAGLGAAVLAWPLLIEHAAPFTPPVWALLGSVLAMGLIGLCDDRCNLRARHKFFGQLLVATLMAAAGLRLETLQLTQGAVLDLGFWSWPVTVLWFVGVSNAVNLIDGLDGLAGGVAAICCAVLAFLGFSAGDEVLLGLSLVLLAGLLVFLRANWSPARVYLGDAGSLAIGAFCAAGTIYAVQVQPRYDSLLLPAIALSVALFDVAISVMRRVLERRSPFAPDRGHIHHVLLGLGLRQARVVTILHLTALLGVCLGLVGYRSSGIVRMFSLLAGLSVVWALFWGVGYFRIRATMSALRSAMASGREQREDQREFEMTQLAAREAEDLGSWWLCVTRLAARWGFYELEFGPRSEGLERQRSGLDAHGLEAANGHDAASVHAASVHAAASGHTAASGHDAASGHTAASGHAAASGHDAANGRAATNGHAAASGHDAANGHAAASGRSAGTANGDRRAHGQSSTKDHAAAHGRAAPRDLSPALAATRLRWRLRDVRAESLLRLETPVCVQEGELDYFARIAMLQGSGLEQSARRFAYLGRLLEEAHGIRAANRAGAVLRPVRARYPEPAEDDSELAIV